MPHLRSSLFILMLAVALMSSACPDGSPPMPVVVTVTPTGVVGQIGATAVFTAEVPPDSPDYTFTWDFDGGATPDTPTGNPVGVTLGAADTYEGSVVVTEGETTVATEPFEFTVVETTIAVTAVALSPGEGLPLATTTLSAATEGETPVAWQWEFAEGALPATSTDEHPEVVRQNAGNYTGRVRVQDGDDLWSEWFEFEYEVTSPVAPEWRTITLADYPTSESTPGIALHMGRLAILQQTPSGIRLVRALIEDPQGPDDFVSHLVTTQGYVAASRQQIVSIEDRLAFVFGAGLDEGGALTIAIATVEEPTGSEDWLIYAFDDPWAKPYYGAALLSRGDKLALLFHGTSETIGFAQSSVAFPESSNDWDLYGLESAPDTARAYPSLVEIDGRLYGGYDSNTGEGGGWCALIWATTEDPGDAGDWTGISLPNEFFSGYGACAVNDVGGLPAITYTTGLAHGYTRSTQRVLVASSLEPAGDDDFVPLNLLPSAGDAVGGIWTTSAGRSSILFLNAIEGKLVLARQVGVDLTSPSAWTLQEVVPSTLLGNIVDNQGNLIVTWVDSATGTLRVTFADGSF